MDESVFSEDELARLAMLPPMVGSAVAFSEKSGMIGTIKEMLTLSESVTSASETYPGNQLIQMAVDRFDGESEEAEAFRDREVEKLLDAGMDTADKIRAHVMAEASAVNELLAKVTDEDEAAQYRQWVMAIAKDVAEAAKEGGFLGFGGTRVSEGEEETIAAVATALGVTN